MRSIFLISAAVAVLAIGGFVQAGSIPTDLWLRAGETYVDLDGTNTPVLATTPPGWGFPDPSDSPITVYGNCADSGSGNPTPEMDTTISGLIAEADYDFDVVMVGKQNVSATSFGVSASYVSGALDDYDMVGAEGRQAALTLDNSNLVLYRVPLGTKTADVDGKVHVFMDNYANRTEVDGVIFRSPVTPPTPQLIGAVDRTNGDTDDKAPIGSFTGDTDPLASSPDGIQLGNPAMSDRIYVFDMVDEPLKGAEFVRTFNEDRDAPDVNYEVQFLQSVFAMVMVDDRAVTPQVWVDAVVDAFASPGTFTDTGDDLSWNEEGTSDPRTFSAYGAWLNAGTYNFGGALRKNSGDPGDGLKAYGMIAAIPEPSTMTLAIMLAATLGLLARGRRRD